MNKLSTWELAARSVSGVAMWIFAILVARRFVGRADIDSAGFMELVCVIAFAHITGQLDGWDTERGRRS